MRPSNFQGNIHIINFPSSTSAAELAELFDEFGLVLGAHIKAIPSTGGHLRLGIVSLAPDKVADKAIEALQGYIRRSFFAGRDFASVPAMVADARRWCTEVAGRRTPRALEGRTPLEVFESDEASALQRLPMVPFELARWSRPKVGPDAHAKRPALCSACGAP